jgi:hypothetical protein
LFTSLLYFNLPFSRFVYFLHFPFRSYLFISFFLSLLSFLLLCFLICLFRLPPFRFHSLFIPTFSSSFPTFPSPFSISFFIYSLVFFLSLPFLSPSFFVYPHFPPPFFLFLHFLHLAFLHFYLILALSLLITDHCPLCYKLVNSSCLSESKQTTVCLSVSL